MVDAIDFHLVKHLQRVRQCLRNIREDIIHLLTGLEPLLLGISHTVRIVQVLAGSYTEQVVVGLSRLLVLEVAVVGTYELDAVFPSHLYEHLVGLLLQLESLAVGQERKRFLHLVALKLQIVVVAKEIMIPLASLAGSLDVAMQYLRRNLTGNTCRTDYQILVVFLQVGTIGSRTHIVSIHPGITDQLDEVLVSIIVFGKDDEVVTTHIALVLLTVFLSSAGHVHLTANDRLEGLQSLFLTILVHLGAIIREFLNTEHHTMVGNSHTLHAVLDGLVNEMRNLRLTVEDGILRMHM